MQLSPFLERPCEPVAVAALAERVVWRNLNITLHALHEVVAASEECMELAKALLVAAVDGAILNVNPQRLRTVLSRNTDPPIPLARSTEHLSRDYACKRALNLRAGVAALWLFAAGVATNRAVHDS